MIHLCYQRFLEIDSPPTVPPETAPMWSWPVPLSDGSTILTLLYRPLASPGSPRYRPTTQIFHLSANGDAKLWQPGVGYPAPVIFYANLQDHLVGLDLANPEKLYACTLTGEHLWTLETAVRLDNLVAPQSFHQDENQLHWLAAANTPMTATLENGIPTGVRPATDPPRKPLEVHHAHTHLVNDRLYVLEFDPMPRIGCYGLGGVWR
jgi:hypothetical protein